MHTLMMINRLLSCIREDSNTLLESELDAYIDCLKQKVEKDANRNLEDSNALHGDMNAAMQELKD